MLGSEEQRGQLTTQAALAEACMSGYPGVRAQRGFGLISHAVALPGLLDLGSLLGPWTAWTAFLGLAALSTAKWFSSPNTL